MFVFVVTLLIFLFNNCGSSVRRRPGKLFNRSDFNSVYFCDSNFVFCNDSKKVFVFISLFICIVLLSLLN